MQLNSTSVSEPVLPRLLLGDDHQLILDALGVMMKNEFDVFAVDNSQAFVSAVDKFQPDIALLDISMPESDGFVTARKALEQRPDLPIVFFSMHSEPSFIDKAGQVGAKAYLSKRLPAQDVINTLKIVLEGATLLPVAPATADNTSGPAAEKNDLTGRQREVLRLIAIGCSAKDIANRLNISVRTAEFHRAAIMQRLGLHSTAQMTRYAISNNIS